MTDTEYLAKLDYHTMKLADSVGDLLEDTQSNDPLTEALVENAQIASSTLTKVQECLEIAIQVFGNPDDGDICRNCGVVTEMDFEVVHVVLCPDHIKQDSDEHLASEPTLLDSDDMKVLQDLNAFYGKNRVVRCVLCFVEITGFLKDSYGTTTSGKDPFGNGIYLKFSRCHLESEIL